MQKILTIFSQHMNGHRLSIYRNYDSKQWTNVDKNIKTYDFCTILSVKSFSKDSDNEYIDQEWYQQGNGSFDKEIFIGLSDFYLFLPVNVTRLEKNSNNNVIQWLEIPNLFSFLAITFEPLGILAQHPYQAIILL